MNENYLNFLGMEKLPTGYWGSIDNLTSFVEYVASKEGYTENKDWYKCSRKKLTKYGLIYGITIENLLNKVYNTNYFEKDKFLKELSDSIYCISEGCKIQSRYNYEGEKKALYCNTHKKEGMVNIKNKKCISEGCKINPYYNYEGKKTSLYCKTHKLEGMVDIKNIKCISEGCKKQPTYNYEGEIKALYCNIHKKEDMIDVKHISCISEGCKTRPSYNYEDEKKALYCKTHKLESMIDIVCNKCIFEGCKITPNYNYEDEKKALYCKTHKLEGMIDINHFNCIFDGCRTRPVFNYEGENKALYCVIHKKENMINVSDKRCEFEGCFSQPNYNYDNLQAKFCGKHKLENMIDVKNKNRRCKTNLCYTLGNKKYEGYCLYCYVNTFPDKPITRNYKTKEKYISDFIYNNFNDYKIVKDKRIEGGCSLRRPDILIDLGYRVIIIEVDENQHDRYDCSCENKRIMEIYKDVDLRPIVFIRFNPDDYINDKNENVISCWSPNSLGILQINKNKEKEWYERLKTLKTQIEYWIENESDKAIEIVQLYYDSNFLQF